jgi:hypothetical protein
MSRRLIVKHSGTRRKLRYINADVVALRGELEDRREVFLILIFLGMEVGRGWLERPSPGQASATCGKEASGEDRPCGAEGKRGEERKAA